MFGLSKMFDFKGKRAEGKVPASEAISYDDLPELVKGELSIDLRTGHAGDGEEILSVKCSKIDRGDGAVEYVYTAQIHKHDPGGSYRNTSGQVMHNPARHIQDTITRRYLVKGTQITDLAESPTLESASFTVTFELEKINRLFPNNADFLSSVELSIQKMVESSESLEDFQSNLAVYYANLQFPEGTDGRTKETFSNIISSLAEARSIRKYLIRVRTAQAPIS